MTANYFIGGSKGYFKADVVQEKKEDKKDFKKFDILTDRYTKTNVKVVIEEYELKD